VASPRFSIVIPTRERAETFRWTLRNCCEQDFDNYEVIVSDNHSTPATKQIVEELASPRVRYIRAPEPLAMSANWELGVSQARGEYVIVVGDDDALMPGALGLADRLLRESGLSVIRWDWVFYNWPDHLFSNQANRLEVPLGRKFSTAKGHDVAESVLNQGAWHPELPFISTVHYVADDFTGLRTYVSEMTLLCCLFYLIWSVFIIHGAYRQQGLSFWSRAGGRRLSMLRSLSLLNALFPVLIGLVKAQFYEDLGDHILASYITLTIYATSFLVLRDSDFFRAEPSPKARAEPTAALIETKKKYEKSALSPEVEKAILTKLNHLTTTEKLYLNSDLSLPKLADHLGTSPHYVSQVLNDRLGQTFFDWLATHRIAEAQQLLNDPATAHLKIEEIAERVGYNAPSAFHTAFKRITGQTPASFRSKGSV